MSSCDIKTSKMFVISLDLASILCFEFVWNLNSFVISVAITKTQKITKQSTAWIPFWAFFSFFFFFFVRNLFFYLPASDRKGVSSLTVSTVAALHILYFSTGRVSLESFLPKQ